MKERKMESLQEILEVLFEANRKGTVFITKEGEEYLSKKAQEIKDALPKGDAYIA